MRRENWVYKAEAIDSNSSYDNTMTIFQKMGTEGWELIQVMDGEMGRKWSGKGALAIFKRPADYWERPKP